MTMMTQQLSQPDFDYALLDRMMEKTKGRLFFKKGTGLLGSLLCNHTFIWDSDAPTAQCDGERIAFNPDFFLSKLTAETRVTVLAHELWHTGFDHMHRRGNRDPKLWNYAADFVINGMLDDAGFSFEGLQPCLDHQYDGMTTEQVYNLLEKDPSRCPVNPDLSGDIVEDDKITQEQVIKKQVKAVQAAKLGGTSAGNIPGEIEQIIDKFLNPVLPWEVLLQRYFTDLSQDDYSWRRPSRRYVDEYLPSLMGENGLEHLIYYLDVSGSISDQELLRFNSEVKFIHDELRPKRLTLVQFDDIIQEVIEFEQDDAFDKIKVTGRGGTNLEPVRAHIEEHMPTAAVIFSDMWVPPMSRDPGVPIFWIVMNNPYAQTKFGTQIHIKKEDL